MTQPSPALRGLKVIDLSRVRAGPTCARIFADFGADVIKVETPPGLDPNESMSGPRHGYDMLNLHRNKRSLTLNLKTADGRAVLTRLIETADVVIENFRPDVKERLGLDYDTLAAINPRVILVSVSGFGQTGPYRMRGGFDQIAQGMGGLMAVTGEPGRGPMRAGVAVADSSAGLYAALGVMIALHERVISGLGQWVQTSLLEAQIGMMDFQAARYLVDGVAPTQAGNDHPYSTPMGVYATADGHINIAAGGEGNWRKLCETMERTDLLDDPEFANEQGRFEARPRLKAELERTLKTRSSAQWLEALERAGVPAGPIYSLDEVFADPQVKHLGMRVRVNHHARGEVDIVRTPINLSRTPAAVVSASPDPGEHNADILTELGFDAEAIARLRANQAI
ncbi:MAG: CoA transferase [Salinarimonadaceae bacterium]|nr:MAG: CoA transferase [Salinarimonadaceae bacterium]